VIGQGGPKRDAMLQGGHCPCEPAASGPCSTLARAGVVLQGGAVLAVGSAARASSASPSPELDLRQGGACAHGRMEF
jgi:hypothetical protein